MTAHQVSLATQTASIFDENVRRILLVRLRSIGDTVLLTPCLTALKSWRSDLEVDVLVESLAAPVLQVHPQVTQLFVLPDTKRGLPKLRARTRIISALRARRYDIAINLHGGTTATFITRLSGARVCLGYAGGQYSSLLNLRAPRPELIWQKSAIHCVEQQLALLKWAGLPLNNPPPLSLAVEPAAAAAVAARLARAGITGAFAVVHPSAAFASKQWDATLFARAIEHLQSRHQLPAVVVVAPHEAAVAAAVTAATATPVVSFNDLNLSEFVALIARAQIFLGNDSGPAHIAAAFARPLVVIFGSSNWRVWHPWTASPYRLLRAEMACAPCPGYRCAEFPEPECIKRISLADVTGALDELLGREEF